MGSKGPHPVLLVSGVHPNERAAPLMAVMVRDALKTLGRTVRIHEIPFAQTFLGLLDDPEHADPRYLHAERQIEGRTHRILDSALWSLYDELNGKRYPDPILVDFHNMQHTARTLGIRDGMKPEAFEIGIVAPRFIRPFQMAAWWNGSAVPGKKTILIEFPAVHKPVSDVKVTERIRSLARFAEQGITLMNGDLHYVTLDVDLEATRAAGFLDPCLAEKTARWIVGELERIEAP